MKNSEIKNSERISYTILGLDLEQTCFACPEQYDVWMGDECVGYLRLRHGWFYAECNGITVYETNDCKGDGIFEYEEREFFLTEAVKAILKHLVSVK
mgnify:CR=1 FL=1